jgi:hypothetical protein
MAFAACPACHGLVPASRSVCLHCDQPLTARWRWLRRLLAVATAGAATMTLMACYGGPSTFDDCLDQDNDGWFPGCYDEPCDPSEDPYCDCNDFVPTIHPGAPDPLGDGLDQDCSGEDGPAKCEGDCPDAAVWPDAASSPDAPDAVPDAPDPLPDAATAPP